MISCEQLYAEFKKCGLTFFSGVPDSTFKDWMKFLVDEHGSRLTNIVAANECEAVATVGGYHLRTGNLGVVYMQNSGLGKAVNPLTSLTDREVYSIPLLLMIGWRGEPGKKDEPQHKKMGRITESLLDVLEVPHEILPDDPAQIASVMERAVAYMRDNGSAYAILIKKGTLEEYKAKKKMETNYEMSREDAIKAIVDSLDGSEVISSTIGKTSRELFEYREILGQDHCKDFLTVGSMGCTASIANGIALSDPNSPVFIFDGDGAVIMQMGTLATIGHYEAKNLYHIVFDNGSYDSTGGQPTVSPTVDLGKVALACGYKGAKTVETKADLVEAIKYLKSSEGPQMLIVKVNKGAREDLGRPTTTPIENKEAFMEKLKK
ncbi:MAG: phosphonopyruvate decarboxylase [Candidatus Woesearchaeota archaeon]|jgi:phosphonopyruvate decarboxylase|nr:phosphonopyruvate decarboxylase [Candidatus Woesearchaeota archaeon]